MLCLAVPAYVASTRAPRVGGPLAWYHHVGLVTFSLIFALGVLALIVLILAGSGWIMGRIERAIRRARPGKRRTRTNGDPTPPG